MKCRKLISAVLALCMVLTSFGALASADEVVSYDASVITFSYGEEPASALLGGKTLTAKVSVSKTGGEQNMTFAMLLYKNNKPVDADISTKPVSGETVDFDVSFTTPADVTGCHVVAFLWDSLKGMNAVCNSAIFPGGSTKVTAITVDGAPLAGFSPDVYNYTYEVEAARTDAPVITAKAFDGSAKINVVNPTDFPGKSVVQALLPDGTKGEYTISYVAKGSTEFLTDLTTCYDDKLPEAMGGGSVTHKAEYAPKSLSVGQDGYLSRSYKIETVNDERLLGKDRVMLSYSLTAVNNGGSEKDVEAFQSAEVYPWVNFTLLRGATVRVLLVANGKKAKLTDLGYKEEISDNANGFYNVMVGSANKAHKYMYSKHYDAGSRVSVPNVGEGGTSVYTVVVDYDPFGYVPGEDEPVVPDEPDVPVDPEDESLLLKSLSVDGALVADFNAETNEYTVNLSAQQASAKDYPVVTYELSDSASTATLTNPTEFPGKATVTVKNTENKTNTYTVNYVLSEELLNLTTNVADKKLMYIPQGLDVDGRVAADRDPKTGWYISEVNYDAFKKNDLIVGGVNSTEGVNEFTFNLPRKATVTVVFNTAGAAAIVNANGAILKEKGFTYENDTSYYKIVVSNRQNEHQRWYRMMYYKDVDTGSLTLPYCVPEMPALVMLKYIPWGADDFGEEPDIPDVPDVPDVNDLALKSLSVDGVRLTDFDADTKEYTVNLTNVQAGALDAPVVTYELEDTKSSAVVANPTEFPGKATVTVSDGEGGERTYTITYTADEMIKDMYVLNESNTISKAYTGADTDTVLSGNNLPKYVRAGLVEYTDKQPIYTDRNGTRGIHDESLIGNDVILTPVNWSQDAKIKAAFGGSEALDWLNFTVKRDAVVKVFTGGANPSNTNITDYGFTKYTNGVMNVDCCNTAKAYFCNKINGTLDRCQTIMYTKNFKAGDKVTVPNFTFGDYSYTVVIEYTDWDEEIYVPVIPKASLSDIKVDGVSITGFDAETLNYEVEFDAASLTMPEVTYTVNGEGVATVTNPASFPGEAKITVTEGDDENVYTIKYVPSKEYITDLKLCDEANVASTHAVFPKVVSGIKAGDKHFTDRGYAIETINEEGIENSDRIMTATGWRWDEQPYATVFNGSTVNDWMSFTLNRGAYVTVYDDSTADNSMFVGFETESSSTPYIYVKYNETRGASYTVKHTRYFTAGSQVNIPNASTGETYAVVVTYAPWNFEEPEVEEIPEFKISYSDLVPKVTTGDNANVTVGNWYNYTSETNMNRKLSKAFTMPEGAETQTITLTLDKFTNQNVAIIVNPTEEGASKDVIVNSDGSAIQWDTHNWASVDYDYEGAGEDGFNADYVTYAEYAKNVTALSSGDSYVYRNMVSSDDKYISGSMVVYNRNLLCGGVAWMDIPEEYEGCNYIVPQDGKINGGTYTLTFTVNAPVEVAIYTNVAAATVSDDISADEWTIDSAAFKKRHMNVVDNLTIAYMIKKGYLPLADIGAYATANNTNGYRIRRYDVFPMLMADCGVDNGWAIDPAKKEATGFTGTINDYTYEQYLDAWVEE